MARKGLPKKYAKMGFKKGWKAFKASKRSRTITLKRTVSKTAKRRRRPMAKRKVMRRRKSSIGGVGKLMLGGAIYGVAREPINQLASKVPFVGNLGDEVALLAINFLIATKTKGMVRQIGRAGLMIEAYNLARGTGGSLLGGILGTSSTTTATTTTQNSFR
tara:strand:- start:316 stop:798 length:483 start_codon:yes stop_codon:yes gene_type:complete